MTSTQKPTLTFQNTKPLKSSNYQLYVSDSSIGKVVLKQFNKNALSFSRESRIYSLSHPNISSPLTSFHHSQHSFIVSKFYENGDLYTLINKINTPLPEKLVRAWLSQLLNAIEFLHNNKLAHLDIKPENILVDE